VDEHQYSATYSFEGESSVRVIPLRWKRTAPSAAIHLILAALYFYLLTNRTGTGSLLASACFTRIPFLVSPGTVDLQCITACPWIPTRTPAPSSVPKALLARCSIDWRGWNAWADRSLKALLRGRAHLYPKLLSSVICTAVARALSVQLAPLGGGLFDNGPPPHRPLKRNLDRERQAHWGRYGANGLRAESRQSAPYRT
jgi:hypothetical protein